MSNSKLTKTDWSLWGLITKTIRPLGKKGPMPTASIITAADIKPSIRPWHPVLDLHGMTLHDAHRAFREHIKTALRLRWKNVTVITGKSGAIFVEFPYWLDGQPIKSSTLQPNGGSYQICLELGPLTPTR